MGTDHVWDDDEDDDDISILELVEELSDSDFMDPGGTSALRAAGPGNPRNLPCPNCGIKNALTPKDVALGYQCDRCADAAESGSDC